MTYEEAIAAFPHSEVKFQVDDIVRPMTQAEYDEFIERQINAEPVPS